MRSHRLANLEKLPALARARQRRAAVAATPAAPPLPAVITPASVTSATAPPPPKRGRSRTPDSLTIGSRSWGFPMPHKRGGSVVPYLRLSGRWLEEHGFTVGSWVDVHVADGRVILTNAATVEAENEARVAEYARLHGMSLS